MPVSDPIPPYLDRAHVADATALIVRFGVHARGEAEQRAAESRDIGNYVHFCRWREVGRLIEFLAAGRASGTVH